MKNLKYLFTAALVCISVTVINGNTHATPGCIDQGQPIDCSLLSN